MLQYVPELKLILTQQTNKSKLIIPKTAKSFLPFHATMWLVTRTYRFVMLMINI